MVLRALTKLSNEKRGGRSFPLALWQGIKSRGSVVYFQQQTGARDAVRWSKSSFWHFSMFYCLFSKHPENKKKECKK